MEETEILKISEADGIQRPPHIWTDWTDVELCAPAARKETCLVGMFTSGCQDRRTSFLSSQNKWENMEFYLGDTLLKLLKMRQRKRKKPVSINVGCKKPNNLSGKRTPLVSFVARTKCYHQLWMPSRNLLGSLYRLLVVDLSSCLTLNTLFINPNNSCHQLSGQVRCQNIMYKLLKTF